MKTGKTPIKTILADAERQIASLNEARIKLMVAQAERDRRWIDYKRLLDREQRLKKKGPKKKAGRPSLWRSRAGRDFVLFVEETRRQRGWGIARSIREALKRREWNQFRKRGRAPEVRFQDARAFWNKDNPWAIARRAWERETKQAAFEAAQAAVQTALDGLQRLLGIKTK